MEIDGFAGGLAAQEVFLRKHPVDDGGGVIVVIPGRHPIPHTGQRFGGVNPALRFPGQIYAGTSFDSSLMRQEARSMTDIRVKPQALRAELRGASNHGSKVKGFNFMWLYQRTPAVRSELCESAEQRCYVFKLKIVC